MSYGIITNLSETTQTWGGVTILSNSSYICNTKKEANMFGNDELFIDALVHGLAKVNNDINDLNINDALQYLLGRFVYVESLPEANPFALPTHRTKNDATESIIEILPNTSEEIEYLISQERYVFGGEMIIENAVFGDYVDAEVVDLDGVIPEAYRSALCEDYPIVAQYIEKRWIMPANAQGYSFCVLDTRPLTAKITEGLYLRVTYHAVNSGNTRRIVINYHLTKKI